MFKLPADFPQGGISNVPGLLMKEAESTPGVPLAGVGVKAAPNFFLIALSIRSKIGRRLTAHRAKAKLLSRQGTDGIPRIGGVERLPED
jgi:hypothetical protein